MTLKLNNSSWLLPKFASPPGVLHDDLGSVLGPSAFLISPVDEQPGALVAAW